MTEFVDGWILGHTLGEGAYGEVKLVINKSTGEAVAMKMVDLEKHPDARQSVRKETTIHRMLSNPHIIQYFGQRSEPKMEYIFLEYASGGELFDRIEPDIGMPCWEAQRYFKQLISAVEYLHSRGVAHRDLKPENLLLDDKDNLKVTDFGLATVYRLQGKERCLDKRCGTLPYVAPEVLMRPYHAEPADVWSCGIIFVALLAGELPWDQSLADCPEYVAWREGKYMSLTPWKKLDNTALGLIRKILVHVPSARYTIKDIEQHRWYLKIFRRGKEMYESLYREVNLMLRVDEQSWLLGQVLSDSEYMKMITQGNSVPNREVIQIHRLYQIAIPKRSRSRGYPKSLCLYFDYNEGDKDHIDGSIAKCMRSDDEENLTRVCLSQPELPGMEKAGPVRINLDDRPGFSFSQPAHVEDLLLCTQLQALQNTQPSQNTFQRLVRRMTRFFVRTDCEMTVKILVNCLENENYNYRLSDVGIITVSTVDRRKMPLVFKTIIVDMDGKILVDFRLSKGCGLEFKRRFIKIKSSLNDVIIKGPITWPIAVATKTMP